MKSAGAGGVTVSRSQLREIVGHLKFAHEWLWEQPQQRLRSRGWTMKRLAAKLEKKMNDKRQ